MTCSCAGELAGLHDPSPCLSLNPFWCTTQVDHVFLGERQGEAFEEDRHSVRDFNVSHWENVSATSDSVPMRRSTLNRPKCFDLCLWSIAEVPAQATLETI